MITERAVGTDVRHSKASANAVYGVFSAFVSDMVVREEKKNFNFLGGKKKKLTTKIKIDTFNILILLKKISSSLHLKNTHTHRYDRGSLHHLALLPSVARLARMDVFYANKESDANGRVHARSEGVTPHRVDLPAETVQVIQVDMSTIALPITQVNTIIDTALSGIMFIYALLQQAELAKRINIVGIIILMFAAYSVLSSIHEHIEQMMTSQQLHRVWIGQWVMRALYILVSFLSGLFVRLISDPLISGPRFGPFGFSTLLWPLTAVLIILVFCAQMRLSTQHRQHLVNAILNEQKILVQNINEIRQKINSLQQHQQQQ